MKVLKFVFFIIILFFFNLLNSKTIFIESGSEWRYLDDGSNQGINWRDLDFNDSLWSSGSSQLGYGERDEECIVSYGEDSDNKYITTYFRYIFEVTDISQHKRLLCEILRDDGVVVYLNNVEIVRDNMPHGVIDYLTLPLAYVSGDEEDMFFKFYLSSDLIVEGRNIIAVEVHQADSTSSDMSFNLKLSSTEQTQPITRKAPYLIYNGINTEMVLLWQTCSQVNCSLEWGEDTFYGNNELVLEYRDNNQYKYIFSELTPSTFYYYRVSIEDEIFKGSFTSAPFSDEDKVNFFIYGDTRSYPSEHNEICRAIRSVYEKNENYQTFIIAVGDLVNKGDNENDWDNQFFNRSYLNIVDVIANLPYQSAMGNHEKDGILFSEYFPYPFANNHYWSYDYGPVHISVIDQYINYEPGSDQLIWLENDLSTTEKKWKFIVMHEPGWSAGGHENNIEVQEFIQPLCEKYNVSIVFAGHNHYYARAEFNGIQHITTGGGGAPLYNPSLKYPHIVTASRSHHFCGIEIKNNLLSFYAITPEWNIIDKFYIDINE